MSGAGESAGRVRDYRDHVRPPAGSSADNRRRSARGDGRRLPRRARVRPQERRQERRRRPGRARRARRQTRRPKAAGHGRLPRVLAGARAHQAHGVRGAGDQVRAVRPVLAGAGVRPQVRAPVLDHAEQPVVLDHGHGERPSRLRAGRLDRRGGGVAFRGPERR